jgi:hypothetical protein
MARIIGRRGHGTETYPTRIAEGAVTPQPAFAFDQNTTPYTVIESDPALLIASASITLSAGSRVKIEGLASFDGAVAAGRAFISSPSLPELSAVNGSQSFGVTKDLSFRTCNYLAVTDPQPAGLLTIGLNIEVTGDAGARIDISGATVLTLTEILAS